MAGLRLPAPGLKLTTSWGEWRQGKQPDTACGVGFRARLRSLFFGENDSRNWGGGGGGGGGGEEGGGGRRFFLWMCFLRSRVFFFLFKDGAMTPFF